MKAFRGLGPGTCLRDAGPYLFGGSGIKQPTVDSSENRCLELGSHPALALKSMFSVATKGTGSVAPKWNECGLRQ
jgi:hypothetical protein